MLVHRNMRLSGRLRYRTIPSSGDPEVLFQNDNIGVKAEGARRLELYANRIRTSQQGVDNCDQSGCRAGMNVRALSSKLQDPNSANSDEAKK